MSDALTHHKLVHAATEYDRKQSTKRGYNIYALGHYMKAIQDAEDDIANGSTLRAALFAHFNGRLLDVMLRAVGEAKSSADEVRTRDREYFRSIGL